MRRELSCPRCRSQSPDTAEHCHHCGATLRAKCPACSRTHPAADPACTKCGADAHAVNDFVEATREWVAANSTRHLTRAILIAERVLLLNADKSLGEKEWLRELLRYSLADVRKEMLDAEQLMKRAEDKLRHGRYEDAHRLFEKARRGNADLEERIHRLETDRPNMAAEYA